MVRKTYFSYECVRRHCFDSFWVKTVNKAGGSGSDGSGPLSRGEEFKR